MLSSLSRSFQQSHPPPILNCPYDVLCTIFAHADRSALRSLHATCRVLSEAVTPLIYRHIVLRDEEVPEDPYTSPFIIYDYGRFVQSCRINIVHPWNKPQSTLIFFISCLWTMPNLKSLTIWSEPRVMTQLGQLLFHLSEMSEPPPPWHLETFVSNTFSIPQQFLDKQNTSLKHLSAPYLPLSTLEDPRLLPVLTSLRGRFNLIGLMIGSRPVTRVHLEDPLHPKNVMRFTDILNLSKSRVTRVSISITKPSDGFETIYSLAEGAPYIESLTINLPSHPLLDGSLIATDAHLFALRYFNKLRFICLVSVDFSGFDATPEMTNSWAPEKLETIVVENIEGDWMRFSPVWNDKNKEGSAPGSTSSGSGEVTKVRSWVQDGQGKIRRTEGFDEDF